MCPPPCKQLLLLLLDSYAPQAKAMNRWPTQDTSSITSLHLWYVRTRLHTVSIWEFSCHHLRFIIYTCNTLMNNESTNVHTMLSRCCQPVKKRISRLPCYFSCSRDSVTQLVTGQPQIVNCNSWHLQNIPLSQQLLAITHTLTRNQFVWINPNISALTCSWGSPPYSFSNLTKVFGPVYAIVVLYAIFLFLVYIYMLTRNSWEKMYFIMNISIFIFIFLH